MTLLGMTLIACSLLMLLGATAAFMSRGGRSLWNAVRADTSAWRVEHWQKPSGPRGGDFLVCRRVGSRLRVFVGDATGHGAQAEDLADYVLGLVQRDAVGHVGPELFRAWSTAVDQKFSTRFVALAYAELDLATGGLSVLNAGNPPMLVRRGDGSIEALRPTGMPLGLVEDECWIAPKVQTLSLRANDSLVLFTDGLTDRLSTAREHFGMDRVLATVADTAESLVAELTGRVNRFSDPAAEQDDLTVVAIAPAAGASERRRAA